MGIFGDALSKYRRATTATEAMGAVQALIEEIGPELMAYAVRHSRRMVVAEEICQETLLVIALKLGQFNGSHENEFRGWCYRILRNKLVDHLREEKPDKFKALGETELREVLEAEPGYNHLGPGVREDLEYGLALLDASKPECRELLWSHHIWGWSIEDLAEQLALKYDTIRMRLKRCLEAAQTLMAKHR